MRRIAFYILICLITISCDEANDAKENHVGEDRFILGFTFGECGGDCAHLFKLEENGLFQDDESGYWWNSKGTPAFKTQAIDNTEALMEMQSLLTDFPSFLLETTEESFGCPDCADGGAIHVMREIEGKELWWTLDNTIAANPEELQEWIRKVQEFLYSLIN